jgi:hypothetical protein
MEAVADYEAWIKQLYSEVSRLERDLKRYTETNGSKFMRNYLTEKIKSLYADIDSMKADCAIEAGKAGLLCG